MAIFNIYRLAIAGWASLLTLAGLSIGSPQRSSNQIQDVLLEPPPGVSTLGHSIDWSPPYLLVSAVSSRAVVLFERTASGWVKLARQVDPLFGFETSFASAVSAADPWYFSGAPGADQGLGGVSVFRRFSDRFVHVDSMQPDRPELGGAFGLSLSAEGSWLAVGAPARNGGAGAVFLYKKELGGWEFFQELASPIGDSCFFGISCQVREAGYLVIGQNCAVDYAHVYCFEDDWWEHEASLSDPRILAPAAGPGDEFGVSVSIGSDGQLVAVGDTHALILPSAPPGEVSVFERRSMGAHPEWAHVAQLIASDGVGGELGAGEWFGNSVRAEAGAVVVGAWGAKNVVNGESHGAVYGYKKTVDGWGSTETVKYVRDPGFSQGVGRGLAFDGSTVFSGPLSRDAGVSIFENSQGRKFCVGGAEAAQIKVLKGLEPSNSYTLALHEIPQRSVIFWIASMRYFDRFVTLGNHGLCLTGPIQRIGVVQAVGANGDAYLHGVTNARLIELGGFSVGASLAVQAWYKTSTAGRFSSAVALQL